MTDNTKTFIGMSLASIIGAMAGYQFGQWQAKKKYKVNISRAAVAALNQAIAKLPAPINEQLLICWPEDSPMPSNIRVISPAVISKVIDDNSEQRAVIADVILHMAFRLLQRLDYHGARDDSYTIATYKIVEVLLTWCQYIRDKIGLFPSDDHEAKRQTTEEAAKLYYFLAAVINSNGPHHFFARPLFCFKEMIVRVTKLRNFAQEQLGALIYQADDLEKNDPAQQVLRLRQKAPAVAQAMRKVFGVLLLGNISSVHDWAMACPQPLDYQHNPLVVRVDGRTKRHQVQCLSESHVAAPAYRSLTHSLSSLSTGAVENAACWQAPLPDLSLPLLSDQALFLNHFYRLQRRLHYLCRITILLSRNRITIKFLSTEVQQPLICYLNHLAEALSQMITFLVPMEMGRICFQDQMMVEATEQFYHSIGELADGLSQVMSGVNSLKSLVHNMQQGNKRSKLQQLLSDAYAYLGSKKSVSRRANLLCGDVVGITMAVSDAELLDLLCQVNGSVELESLSLQQQLYQAVQREVEKYRRAKKERENDYLDDLARALTSQQCLVDALDDEHCDDGLAAALAFALLFLTGCDQPYVDTKRLKTMAMVLVRLTQQCCFVHKDRVNTSPANLATACQLYHKALGEHRDFAELSSAAKQQRIATLKKSCPLVADQPVVVAERWTNLPADKYQALHYLAGHITACNHLAKLQSLWQRLQSSHYDYLRQYTHCYSRYCVGSTPCCASYARLARIVVIQTKLLAYQTAQQQLSLGEELKNRQKYQLDQQARQLINQHQTLQTLMTAKTHRLKPGSKAAPLRLVNRVGGLFFRVRTLVVVRSRLTTQQQQHVAQLKLKTL